MTAFSPLGTRENLLDFVGSGILELPPLDRVVLELTPLGDFNSFDDIVAMTLYTRTDTFRHFSVICFSPS